MPLTCAFVRPAVGTVSVTRKTGPRPLLGWVYNCWSAAFLVTSPPLANFVGVPWMAGLGMVSIGAGRGVSSNVLTIVSWLTCWMAYCALDQVLWGSLVNYVPSGYSRGVFFLRKRSVCWDI